MAIVGTLVVLLSLPGTLELALLTFAAVLPKRGDRLDSPGSRPPIRKLAVIIPAHNESLNIATTVLSISACECPALLSHWQIVVVADNCTDDTAFVAQQAGARVMARCDDTRRGKGYALQFAFERLTAEGVDVFLVIDADTVVETNLLKEVCRLCEEGADGVQTRYGVLNPTTSIRTRLMNTALMAVNVLRPRGRQRVGLSVGILGNGFALTAATLTAVPYDAHSVVEDLEYGLRLAIAGRHIQFADGTTVRGLMPSVGRGVETQRARWEGGRFRMLKHCAPQLVRQVLHQRLDLIEPLLDLLLLPLALHVVLLAAAGAIPFPPARLYALCAGSLVGLYLSAAIVIGGGDWRDLAALFAAPFYILWKLKLLPKIIRSASRETPWTRTERLANRC